MTAADARGEATGPPGVAVTPRRGPKVADGLARVRGCHCPQRRSSRLNVQPFSGLGLPRGGARRVEPGQTRSGRGWAVSKGGAENWGALGHRGLQLGGASGVGSCARTRPETRVSACGHIPATRVCTRGPGHVVGRAHAWESPVCVCTGSTVGTRVAQLGSNKRCPGRATATTRAVCPTHTRTDTRTPTASRRGASVLSRASAVDLPGPEVAEASCSVLGPPAPPGPATRHRPTPDSALWPPLLRHVLAASVLRTLSPRSARWLPAPRLPLAHCGP